MSYFHLEFKHPEGAPAAWHAWLLVAAWDTLPDFALKFMRML
jgi:hypothetical protein